MTLPVAILFLSGVAVPAPSPGAEPVPVFEKVREVVRERGFRGTPAEVTWLTTMAGLQGHPSGLIWARLKITLTGTGASASRFADVVYDMKENRLSAIDAPKLVEDDGDLECHRTARECWIVKRNYGFTIDHLAWTTNFSVWSISRSGEAVPLGSFTEGGSPHKGSGSWGRVFSTVVGEDGELAARRDAYMIWARGIPGIHAQFNAIDYYVLGDRGLEAAGGVALAHLLDARGAILDTLTGPFTALDKAGILPGKKSVTLSGVEVSIVDWDPDKATLQVKVERVDTGERGAVDTSSLPGWQTFLKARGRDRELLPVIEGFFALPTSPFLPLDEYTSASRLIQTGDQGVNWAALRSAQDALPGYFSWLKTRRLWKMRDMLVAMVIASPGIRPALRIEAANIVKGEYERCVLRDEVEAWPVEGSGPPGKRGERLPKGLVLLRPPTEDMNLAIALDEPRGMRVLVVDREDLEDAVEPSQAPPAPGR